MNKMNAMLLAPDQAVLAAVKAAIEGNPKAVEQYQSGSGKAINALIGAVLKTNKIPAEIALALLRNQLEVKP